MRTILSTPGIALFCVLFFQQSIREARAQDDIADVSSQDLRAARDADKRYFLIKPPGATKPPTDGYRLLIVLPGGDGGAEFLPFVKRLARNALPGGYLVAQPVAKVWNKQQADSFVWPIAKNPPEGVKFPTEDFVEAVIADVRSNHEIDPRYIFTLGWSSSGPPSYALSVRPGRSITGSFVAMSVFFGGMYGDLGEAKGNAYYLLHSPDDFIPITRAENARDLLTKKGAKVKLKTYEGGHGWHGDVFGQVREGIEWLEANHADVRIAR